MRYTSITVDGSPHPCTTIAGLHIGGKVKSKQPTCLRDCRARGAENLGQATVRTSNRSCDIIAPPIQLVIQSVAYYFIAADEGQIKLIPKVRKKRLTTGTNTLSRMPSSKKM